MRSSDESKLVDWNTSNAQIICIQVVPHFAGVQMRMSSARNANPSQRALSEISVRYRVGMGRHCRRLFSPASHPLMTHTPPMILPAHGWLVGGPDVVVVGAVVVVVGAAVVVVTTGAVVVVVVAVVVVGAPVVVVSAGGEPTGSVDGTHSSARRS